MRKLFLSLATLCGCVLTLSAIEYNAAELMKNVSTPLFQNRSAMNQDVVKTATAYLDTVEAKTDAQKLNLLRYRVIAYDQTTGADRTLAGLKKYADSLIGNTKFERALTGSQYVGIFSIWWRRTEFDFAQEMYALIKATPGAEAFCDAGFWANAVGKYAEAYELYLASKTWPQRAMEIALHRLNDPEKALTAATLICERTYSIEIVKSVVRMTVEKLCGNSAVNAAEMKTFLQNVNRKYSPQLINDKAAWEPIIAQVRTVLETY